MRRLIFGCGYLGLRAARRWLASGDHVTALTRSPERAELLRQSGITAVFGDITQPETLTSLPASDTVLFAVGYDRTAQPDKRTVYVDGLRNAVRSVNCETQWISISSSSVYGQSDGRPVTEDSDCEPVTDGGRICLDAEHTLADELARRDMRPPIVLRLTGIYGPGRLLRRMEDVRASNPISGNPDAWLNVIHVDDATLVVEAAARHAEPGELLLVTDDRPVRRREYYSCLARLLQAEPPRFTDTPGEGRSRTPGLNKQCRNDRLQSRLRSWSSQDHRWHLSYPTIEQGLPVVIEGCE